MEVFQEKRFCKPKVSFWGKLFGQRSEEDNFKETQYLSGDMGCMILLLNSIKKWHSKIKAQKSPDIMEKYEIKFIVIKNFCRSNHKIFDLKTLIFELKNQKTLKDKE